MQTVKFDRALWLLSILTARYKELTAKRLLWIKSRLLNLFSFLSCLYLKVNLFLDHFDLWQKINTMEQSYFVLVQGCLNFVEEHVVLINLLKQGTFLFYWPLFIDLQNWKRNVCTELFCPRSSLFWCCLTCTRRNNTRNNNTRANYNNNFYQLKHIGALFKMFCWSFVTPDC